jgi:putative transposase
MSNTYSRILMHVVFSTKRREPWIQAAWEDELYAYIAGIVERKGQKMLAINGMPDHMHMLIGIKVDCSISDLVREVKKSSTNFIRERKFTASPFYWQEGFGAFSYAKKDLPVVARYIANQKLHHAKVNFREEYLELLDEFGIEYNVKYVFD